ncbi:helix-turn-helix domain-containing protein [Rhodocytophaga aerolata]|uniref:Helix-turn-helix domain-containing protein n=1 Tax=Rhodocytophaga aerolata TaxID=455078 RepID=A0ABT8RH90_9BACT|nr:helix-turn-helix domain-containing protein [Rhodocytophaga aerolata]MDO1451477.1 helix-turn-helix domain-containing protein [Rhodocytophaga aerolata]
METLIRRPTSQDRKVAEKSLVTLNKTAAAISKGKSNVVKIKIQESDEFITVPRKALDLLFSILSNMAEGKSISLIPSDSEVSTQQAADILNVSRPHIVKLLEEGKIPFKKVGSHRRILLQDLIQYEAAIGEQRAKSFEFLAKQAQELNLGYE